MSSCPSCVHPRGQSSGLSGTADVQRGEHDLAAQVGKEVRSPWTHGFRVYLAARAHSLLAPYASRPASRVRSRRADPLCEDAR
eukprot:6003825-Prymnesium_polylepis.1